jgi:hypothetical protein
VTVRNHQLYVIRHQKLNLWVRNMLFAAKHRKDRNRNLIEDEITSCILGPLSYMPIKDVWTLFRAWLPYKKEMWPTDIPTSVKFSFWPNLKDEGRIEPDLLVRFSCNGDPILNVLFEIKWTSPISGKDELAKQWEALSNEEKQNTFHVYLVKDTGRGNREVDQSLNEFPKGPQKKLWQNRLVCIGWRSLLEVLFFNRPRLGTTMNLWAKGVIAFLRRRGQTTFTGFEWLSEEMVSTASEKEIFWKSPHWFLMDKKVRPNGGLIFWNG